MAKKQKVKQHRPLRTLVKTVGIVLLVLVLAAVGLVACLSITEYRPQDLEEVSLTGGADKTLAPGDRLTVMTWNIGYGALGDNADFFMDGGSGVQTADEDRVRSNLAGIAQAVDQVSPDVLLLQEVDRDSRRSWHIDQAAWLQDRWPDKTGAFANNFKVAFLPYPVPPIGQVDSGLLTLSSFRVGSAQRVQLPIPFAWPVRMANLKRCLLVEHIPLEGTDRELVLINLHLEAYDNGEGKAAQTAMLEQVLNEQAEAGNYVIAGGDFNQIFSNADQEAYPAQEGKWQAGQIDGEKLIAQGWSLLMDASTPTCRSLDQPYAGADRASFQYYLIDGFILSSNLDLDSVQTQDLGFVYTDHNPVVLRLTLAD